jgi:hypothetical protein
MGGVFIIAPFTMAITGAKTLGALRPHRISNEALGGCSSASLGAETRPWGDKWVECSGITFRYECNIERTQVARRG